MSDTNKQAPASSLNAERRRTLVLAQAALLTALSYVGFQFLRIDLPVGPEKTAFHFGNVFLILAALLIGGLWGGMAGALGMTIADLTSGYAQAAPATFVLKLCIGLIVGLVAEKILHLSKEQNKKNWAWKAAVASAAGIIFNVIADPLIRLLFNKVLYGIPGDIAAKLAKISFVTTGVNGLIAVIAVSFIYSALRPALQKGGNFVLN
ncbi:MAG: ECF transporter S component [Eubacteriales bacterium]|nr:ECF transporter S component [Eubacteriales bacterium]